MKNIIKRNPVKTLALVMVIVSFIATRDWFWPISLGAIMGAFGYTLDYDFQHEYADDDDDE